MVGGFSICSSPRLLEQERMIELAVKHANHPPALWIHNQVSKPLFKLGDLGSLSLTKVSSLNARKEPRLGRTAHTLTESSLPSGTQIPGGVQEQHACLFFTFWPCHVACGVPAPQPGTEPAPHAVEGGVLNRGHQGGPQEAESF